MSLVSFIGPKPNLLDINAVNPPMRLEVTQPILDFDDMARLRQIEQHWREVQDGHAGHHRIPARPGRRGRKGLAVLRGSGGRDRTGHNILIISDRAMNRDNVAIRPCWRCRPSTSTSCARACAPGRPGGRDRFGAQVHHFACWRATARRQPYVALETLVAMHKDLPGGSRVRRRSQLREAIGRGILEDHVRRWACRPT